MRLPVTLRADKRVPLLQVTKAAVATVGSWVLAQWIFPDSLPVFAAIAALLVVQPSVNQSLGKGIERTAGVLVGVLVASGLGLVFGENTWIVLLAIVLAIFIAWALRLTSGTANQVPISAMLVLSIGASRPDYALDRVIETLLGAALAIVVNLLLVPPVLLAPAHTSIVRLANELAASLDRLAAALVTRQSSAQLEELLVTARLLRPMQRKAVAALEQGEESLTLNPRRGRHRRVLEHDTELLRRLDPLVTRIVGMTRSFRDLYDDELRTEPAVQSIATEMTRAAHDLRLLTRTLGQHAGEEPPATGELPALTAPLTVGVPGSSHWVLIGSLLEDMRRVHEAIQDDS